MTGHAGADKPPSGRRQKPAKGSKTTADGGGRERAGSVMQHRQVMVTHHPNILDIYACM